MDHPRPHDVWTNIVVQRPAMETNGGRNPAAALSGPPEDPAALAPRQSDSLLDGEKTAATLLFFGVFLALVGIIFTTMGWHHYLANPTFEWTQLLGPILISVGGTFMLTSVCKFRFISCCRQIDEEVLVIPAMEQTSMGHSYTLSTISQPIMLQGCTKMLHIPPVYNFRTQEVRQTIEFQPAGSVNGVHAAIPPPVYCVDSAAFIAEEAHSAGANHRRSR